ncbi:GEVED domain-containing protein, partial [Planctomycetota bacterium]
VPVNNNCQNATPIGEVVSLSFNTTEANFDGPGLCMTGPNIWYRYTATRSGQITVSLCGSSYDTKLAIYSGSACNPTSSRLISCNDDSCGLQSEITFTATIGNQYLIEVGGYGSYKGQGVISFSGGTTSNQPANDSCQNAEAIGNVTNKSFNTTYATFDGSGGCMQSPNIWYKYTATCNGQATVSLCGSSFDTVLAVYRGSECYPTQSRLIGCNDDSCQQQSQLTFSVESGSIYLIEVGGFSNSSGQGLLSISCAGTVPNLYDLGDAPDSTNNHSRTMTTYSTSVQANFPTVFTDGRAAGPYGPFHNSPRSVAYLGNTVTLELEADTGQDQDSVNNIAPLTNRSNQDAGDDGVTTPVNMPHGKWTTLDYRVNVVTPNTNLYVNVWCDWNRDGDWNDDTTTNPTMTSSKGMISEWAVKNQLLFNLPGGIYQLTTPAFLAWHPKSAATNLWMRISITTVPWTGGTGAGGSGPQAGYQYGETEDYLFEPTQICSDCEDINRDGIVDLNDLVVYVNQWLQNCQ